MVWEDVLVWLRKRMFLVEQKGGFCMPVNRSVHLVVCSTRKQRNKVCLVLENLPSLGMSANICPRYSMIFFSMNMSLSSDLSKYASNALCGFFVLHKWLKSQRQYDLDATSQVQP